MRKVQIYIKGKRIELFDDEKIQINLSVQNVQDIAKIFTEFTQSFTVPATPTNNDIFQHFYENAIDGARDTRLDYKVRHDANIEIDLIPFRTGQVQLEKANVKNGRVESYTITFYGEMVTLKDIFGEDKLEVLDFNSLAHTYTGGIIESRIKNISQNDIEWPLISSDRLWEYGVGGNHDISISSGHIHYTELFPALRVYKIFEAIESHYNIEFDSIFMATITNKRFYNLFLWLKNTEQFEFFTEKLVLDIDTATAYGGTIVPVNAYWDLPNNTFKMVPALQSLVHNSVFFESTHQLRYEVFSISDPTATYHLRVLLNGNFYAEFSETGDTGALTNIITLPVASVNASDIYSFELYCNKTVNIQLRFYYNIDGFNVNGQSIRAGYEAYTNTMTLTGKINVNKNLPDIKIADFVSGIFKQFNLTCTPFGKNKFKIETLETWYAMGRIIDVTKYIDIDSIDIERAKLFKKIIFKHQKSDTLFNTNFRDLFKREYGDLDQVFNYDGNEYTIELPFENLMHNKLSGELQVGYSLDKNLQPVIPKPVLLYFNDSLSCDFYLNNGTSTNRITTYKSFGQDVTYQTEKYTKNFFLDYSTLYNEAIQNNIYNVYYRNYLENLYNPKQRLTYVKGIFPTALLTSLRLNDRLIIRDKRYIINDMKVELTTGDVELVLLHDFRLLEQVNPTINLQDGSTTAEVLVPFPEGVISATFNAQGTGITSTPTTLTTGGVFNLTIPIVNEVEVMGLENGDTFIFEDLVTVLIEDYPYTTTSQPTIDYTFNTGLGLDVPIFINQAGTWIIL